MKRTIRWPLQIVAGRATMTPDPDRADLAPTQEAEALEQLIAISLLDQTNAHPWDYTNPGPRRDPTHGPNSPRGDAEVVEDTRVAFRALERAKRARLVNVTVRRDGPDRMVRVEYVNLETGQRRALEVAANG